MPQPPVQATPSIEPSTQLPGDYQNIQSSPNDFGAMSAQAMGKLSQGAEQASNTFANIAVDKQMMANKLAIDQALTANQHAGIDTLYGVSGDPSKPGYLSYTGQAAINNRQVAEQALEDQRQQIRDSLSNPLQKIQFDNESRKMNSFVMERMGSHYDNQYKLYGQQTQEARINSGMRAITTTYNDDGNFNRNLQDMQDAQLVRDHMAGASDDQVQNNQQELISKAYSNRIIAASASNPIYANQLYEQNKDKLDPQVSFQLSQHLKGINSAMISDAAVSQALKPPPPGQSHFDASPIAQQIDQTANAHGVDPTMAKTIAYIESGMRPTAHNPSGADGIFQVIPTTWRSLGGTDENRHDVGTQIDLGVKNIAMAQITANRAVGGEAQPWQVYMVHQQGAAGGASLLSSPPAMNAVDALSSAYGGNRAIAQRAITGNGGSPNMTVSQFNSMWQAKYTDASQRVVGSPGQLPDREQATANVMNTLADNPQALNLAMIKLNRQYDVQEKARKSAAEASMNLYTTQLLSHPDQFDINKVVNDPNLTAQEKWMVAEHANSTLGSYGGDAQKKSYGPMYKDYLHQALIQVGDPGHISDPGYFWKAAATGDLTVAGAKLMNEIVNKAETPQRREDMRLLNLFLDGAKKQMVKDDFGMADPKGEMRYANFAAHVVPQFLEALDAGKSSSQLLQQESPDWIGKSIPNYVRSQDEITRDFALANPNGVPQNQLANQTNSQYDLNTKEGIQNAYRSGFYGYGDIAKQKAMAALQAKFPNEFIPRNPPQGKQ